LGYFQKESESEIVTGEGEWKVTFFCFHFDDQNSLEESKGVQIMFFESYDQCKIRKLNGQWSLAIELSYFWDGGKSFF
jgi:hypothetical protein